MLSAPGTTARLPRHDAVMDRPRQVDGYTKTTLAE